ncbi:MAG: ferrous iron transport protein B [Actinobacteria bacterium]|nr:ferrous iron transport protein B [Actinomycetota bacterium]
MKDPLTATAAGGAFANGGPAAAETTFALVGNANVGKSVIFNALTGMNQTIGNWPGKTVELAQGAFLFRGKRLRVIDLPGIYSLSAYSQEELVARDFLAGRMADVVIDVVDSTVLERNLYLALQLRELQVPLVLALNLTDLASKEGLEIDADVLSMELGVPVVKTAAASGKGLEELVAVALTCSLGRPGPGPRYGREVEEAVLQVEEALAAAIADPVTASGFPDEYAGVPTRFIAIKLLEGDEEMEHQLTSLGDVVQIAHTVAGKLEAVHGHDAAGVIASERYAVAGRISAEAVRRVDVTGRSTGERLDSFLLHKVLGWFALAVALFAMFGIIFIVGDKFAGLLEELFEWWEEAFFALGLHPGWSDFLWRGIVHGVLAGVSIALPYLVPFYLILSFLENSGYLARMAFLTDSIMHRLGLHGKAFIPIFLGYGCTVPAVLGTRIMERDRDRLIAGILATLIPCSARTVVILGLVGAFVGFWAAISLYIINLIIVFIVGRILNKYLPGDNVGLIMEMPKLRTPAWRVSLKQTWFRLKDFVIFAFPIIVAGSLVLWGLERLGWLDPVASALAPFTETVLGLPAVTLIVLVFGVLRKELALIMLATVLGTTNFGLVLSAREMFVFALIVMLYVPCVSTIAVMRREYGAKIAALVSAGEVVVALALGALVNWIWNLVAAIV